jgi:hypothetical protein
MFTIKTDNPDTLLDDAAARRLSVAIEGEGWKVYGQARDYATTSGELTIALGTDHDITLPLYAHPEGLVITIVGAPASS